MGRSPRVKTGSAGSAIVRVLAAGVVCLALVLGGRAQATRSPAQLEKEGIDHFYNLEYPAAIADFQQLTQDVPISPGAWNVLAEARIYQEMYRIGALESQLYGHGDPFLEEKLLPPDPAVLKQFATENQKAIDLAEQQIQEHPKDAHLHYLLGAAYAVRGTCDFSVKQSYFSALSDAKSARGEAQRAVDIDPNYVDPTLILGIHNYVAGSLPLGAKMLSFLIGYRGDKAKGRQQIAYAAEHGETVRTDAEVMMAVIDRRDGENQEAATYLAAVLKVYPRNVLFAVEQAEASEAAGDHAAALRDYQAVLDQAAKGMPGYERAPLDKVWYDLGNIEKEGGHLTDALADFRKAQSVPGAKPRYMQAAALAAGEMEMQLGDTASAQRDLQKCIEINPDTSAAHEAEKRLHH